MPRVTILFPKDISQYLHDEKNDTGNTINSIMNKIIRDFIFNHLDLLAGDQTNIG